MQAAVGTFYAYGNKFPKHVADVVVSVAVRRHSVQRARAGQDERER